MVPNFLNDYKKPIIKSFIQFGIIITLMIVLGRYLHWLLLAVVISAFNNLFGIIIKIISNNGFQNLGLSFKDQFFSFLKTFVVVSIFLWLNSYSAKHGVYGLIAIVLLLSFYKMWQSREFLGRSKAELEIMIWGFPARKKWRNKLGFSDESVRLIKESNRKRRVRK
jgi:hypothetical protein